MTRFTIYNNTILTILVSHISYHYFPYKTKHTAFTCYITQHCSNSFFLHLQIFQVPQKIRQDIYLTKIGRIMISNRLLTSTAAVSTAWKMPFQINLRSWEMKFGFPFFFILYVCVKDIYKLHIHQLWMV